MKSIVSRIGSTAAFAAAVVGLGSLFASSCFAQVTLLASSSWNSAADGSSLSSPWSKQYGGGSTPAESTVLITTYAGEKWAHVNNAATDEGATNPSLQGNFSVFTSTTSTLTISFEYIIPSNYGNASQIQFALNQYLDNKATTAIRIGLGPNYQVNRPYYVSSTGASTPIAPSTAFTPGEKLTLTLSNISLATHTYDLLLTGSGGTYASISGLTFTNTSVTQLNYITIGENSAPGSTSSIYVRNASVAQFETPSIPEPAGAAVLAGFVACGLAVTRRARRE